MFSRSRLFYLLVLLILGLGILARPLTENGENDASSFWDDSLSSSEEEVENSRRQSEETTSQDEMTSKSPEEMQSGKKMKA
jgi:hypothetical protein